MIRLILLTLFSLAALAQTPNVVLLSSVDTPKIWYHKKDWRIEKTLNKIFKNRFKKSGYNIVIKDRVTQVELRKELNNPNNIAVYWVSHAAGTTSSTDGIGSNGAIVDFYGKDVKDLFKRVHPNIKHLALVGCNARGIINKFKKDGYYKNNKDLTITSFKKKIDARIGLRKAARKAEDVLGRLKKRFLSYPQIVDTQNYIEDFYTQRSCEITVPSFPVKVTRYAKEDTPSVALKGNNDIFAVLPSLKAGESYTTEIYIPVETFNKRKFKLIVDSNIYATSEKQYLGEFELETSWDSSWKLFAKRDGTPLGITSNLYILKGERPSQEDIVEQQFFTCFE
jgi:hypothetical protein